MMLRLAISKKNKPKTSEKLFQNIKFADSNVLKLLQLQKDTNTQR